MYAPTSGPPCGKQQLVFECELLPYLLSLQLWSALLRSKDMLVCIDNDAARASLAKSFKRKEEGARIVHEGVEMEEKLDVQAFFMRVPTFSNIADGPRLRQHKESVKDAAWLRPYGPYCRHKSSGTFRSQRKHPCSYHLHSLLMTT